jgi:hypothetical protein
MNDPQLQLPRLSFSRGRATVTTDHDEVWQVEYTLALRPPSRPIVIDLRVSLRPGVEPPPNGLMSETLRRVKLTDHVRHLDAMVQRMREVPKNPAARARHREETAFRENWLRWSGLGPVLDATPRRGAPRAGRPRLDDVELARAAEVYSKAVATGSPRPVVDAAKRLRVTVERLRDLLHRARVRKYLAAAQPGFASGTVTPLGRLVLARAAAKKRRER